MTVFVLIALIVLMGQLFFNKLSAESGEKLANKKQQIAVIASFYL